MSGRFCGHSPSSSRRSLFSLNYTCSGSQGKQRLSLGITFLHWAHIVRCTYPTGYCGTLSNIHVVAWELIHEWHSRYATEGTVDPIAVISGIVQTCINFYFIYVYWKKYPREIDIESPPDGVRPTQSAPELPKALSLTEAHPAVIENNGEARHLENEAAIPSE